MGSWAQPGTPNPAPDPSPPPARASGPVQGLISPPRPSSVPGQPWPSSGQAESPSQLKTIYSYLIPLWVLWGWGPPGRRQREGAWFSETGVVWQGPWGWWCACSGRGPWPRAFLIFDPNLPFHLPSCPTLTVLWAHPVGLFWRGPLLQWGYLLLREWPFQRRSPPSVLAGVMSSRLGSAEHMMGTQL